MAKAGRFSGLIAALALGALPCIAAAQAATPAPKLVEDAGRHALLVDGAPYLVLGAQIGNSSAWPALLEQQVWPALEAMHVNTGEAPVYWEQIEPSPGNFDWTNVDALVDGARAHHLHLVLLWFGTWKNGNDHYVPQWVKQDPVHYPRMLNSAGIPLDDLSANAPANMEADQKAFAAFMHHLAAKDGTEHTVLMIQVENESGGIGAARDYSAQSNKEFAGPVPAELVKALGKKPGTWSEVFPGTADESFQAWSQARYVNAVAAAGKREFNIPYYCNVWVAYPPAELPERHIAVPGIGYPSGGPNQLMLPIWKFAAPSVDLIGPDLYTNNADFYLKMIETYARPDNPLWIPETGRGDDYAPFFFAALDHGAIGFSPFGVDWVNHLAHGVVPAAHTANFTLFKPMDRTIAKLEYQGKVQAVIEAAGGPEQQMLFSSGSAAKQDNTAAAREALIPLVSLSNATTALADAGTPASRAADGKGDWVAEVRFGFPQKDGEPAHGSADKDGRMMVAEVGPNEFLLAGIGGSVFFHRPGYLPGIRMQILTAEQGYYTPSTTPGAQEDWHMTRVLNGDETDRGIQFPGSMAHTGDTAEQRPLVVRIKLGRF